MYCPRCGLKQPDDHLLCVSCGLRLPHQLLDRRGPKASRWFLTLPVTPGDPDHAAIRVSRYLEDVEVESEGQSVRIPAGHVRFSVWVDDHAVSAVSLPEDEARALAEFLLSAVGPLEPADSTDSTDSTDCTDSTDKADKAEHAG